MPRTGDAGVAPVFVLLMLTACSSATEPPAAPAPLQAPQPAFDWRLPPGFPVPSVPADNPMSAAKVELGRHLFYDRRLSGNGNAACASCHRQELAFTDGRPQAVGTTGEVHPRGAMSLANVAYHLGFAWADPTLSSLEEQARVPMFNRTPVELGVEGSGEAMLDRLAADPRYEAMFAAAFPEDGGRRIRLDNVLRALAAFERTLISGNAAYDSWLYRDESAAVPEAARRGMRLFFSERLGCFKCHSGFDFSGAVTFEGAPPRQVEYHNTGLYNLAGGSYPAPSPGLIEHSARPQDMGRFRAPTLRNVAVTAPYMHDGSIATLAEVLDHYAAGGRTLESGPHAGAGRDNPFKNRLVTGFPLTADEKSDVVAFLECLTDEDFLGDPRFADPWPATSSNGTSGTAPRTAPPR